MLEIVQKEYIIFVFERLKKIFIPFIRSNIERRCLGYSLCAQFKKIFCGKPRFFVLKVATSYMHSIILSIRMPTLSHTRTNSFYNTAGRTHEFVLVSDVVSYEPFRPKVHFPILEKDVSIGVYQEPGLRAVINLEVHQPMVLHLCVIDANIFTASAHLAESIFNRCIHWRGFAVKVHGIFLWVIAKYVVECRLEQFYITLVF
mmetsp:Transcript_9257/g.20454  ORF Transcript_9257/g.20454 Transcript_9257/m.20454 type:complete len:202 (+) Transcript_9257:982-1587(+)